MTKENLKKVFLIIFAVFAVFTVSFYYLAGDQLRFREAKDNIEMPDADSVTPEIIRGVVVEQEFVNTVDNIDQIAIVFTKLYREGKGLLSIDLLEGEELLSRNILDVDKIPEQHRVYIDLNGMNGMKGKTLKLRIYSNSRYYEGVSVMMNQ